MSSNDAWARTLGIPLGPSYPLSMETPNVSSARGRVLVVDDDPVVLEIVREWLENSGYRVDVRDKALGTAQWVEQERPDYVMLDVKMPALSGGELTQLIRRRQSAAEVAVILHSSMESDALDALARSTGALGAIKKTSNAKMFIAAFDRLVARHHASNSSR